MNGRIERNLTPREDFLVEMFQDDPRLVEALRESKRRINWSAVGGAFIAITVSTGMWAGLIYAVLYVKGWLQ